MTHGQPHPKRRVWYAGLNGVVLAWLLVAAVSAVVHRWAPEAPWLLTHVMLLGAVTTAILVWSAYFADALLRRPAPGGLPLLAVRVGTHALAAVVVMVGVVTGTWALVVGGGAGVVAVALAHLGVISIQRHRATTARLGGLPLFYMVATVFLAVGAVAGIVLARTMTDPQLQGRLHTAHMSAMLLGFVGLTVLGTLVLLWPTMLRTKMAPSAPRQAGHALWVLGVAVAAFLVGAMIGEPPTVLAGTTAYLVGTGVLVAPMVLEARARLPRSFAAWSAAAAVLWAIGCTVALGVVVATSPSWSVVPGRVGALTAPFVAGFAGQVLLGALSYLAPVVLGGGPAVVRAVDQELDRAAGARVVVLNGCLLLFVLPGLPSLVRVTTSALGLAAMCAFLVLLVRALLARRRAASDGTLVTTTIGTGPPAPPRRLGPLAGLSAVVLAVALGVAGDPAAAGLGGSGDAEIAASGETTTVAVEARDMRFHPARVEVPAGDRLVLEVTNTDDDVHDLVLADGSTTGRLGPGQTADVDAGIVGADLEGWCSVAGHRQMGMTLDVVVTDAPAASTSHGEHGAGDGGHDRGSGAEGGPDAAADLDLMAEPGPGFAAHDPALTAAPDGEVHRTTLRVSEMVSEVAPGVRQERWTFGGSAPGPVLRGSVGDVFEVTLVNDGSIGHSIDFHAGSLAPDEPMRTIGPGESLTYTFTAERSGVWMYHCSTAPMSVHIANGMHGAVVVDPPDLEPADREYLLVQSEIYLGTQGGTADAAKIAAEDPDLVVFNGYANQYDHAPLTATVGERVRIWVLDAGPSRSSAFHVVGGQFDTVYSEGRYLLGGPDDAGGRTGGAQVLPLLPAQGGFVELSFPEAGHYPLVSHAMVDAERGAHGIVEVLPRRDE